jgi:hypothetical protein
VTASFRGRVVDDGAVFAGWIGLGLAAILAIAFELVVAVQSLVFLLAAPAGLLIGVYANVRSERYRPRRRVLANAAWAGLVTGLGLAVIYVLLRLVFLFGDTGDLPGGGRLDCRRGPECTYTRYVEAGRGDDLAQVGVVDAATYQAAALREHVFGALALAGVTLAGALVGGVGRSVAGGRPSADAAGLAVPGTG